MNHPHHPSTPAPHEWAPPALDEESMLLQMDERRRARNAARRRPILSVLALNMTPMIDCVFLLLIYFILTSDFRAPEDALSLDPQALAGAADPRDDLFELPARPIVIVVRSLADGPSDFSLTIEDPTLAGVASVVELRRRAAAARGVTLPLDQGFTLKPADDARWEHALAVCDALQRAGYTNVQLANPARASR